MFYFTFYFLFFKWKMSTALRPMTDNGGKSIQPIILAQFNINLKTS